MTELKRLLREYISDMLNKDKLAELKNYCDEYFIRTDLMLDRGHIAVAKMSNILVTGD